VAYEVLWTSSFFKVAKNDSAITLSQHTPVRPIEPRMLCRFKQATKSTDVYCEPRSEWKIASCVTLLFRTAMSTASIINEVFICDLIEYPTTSRVYTSITVARNSQPCHVGM